MVSVASQLSGSRLGAMLKTISAIDRIGDEVITKRASVSAAIAARRGRVRCRRAGSGG